MPDWGILLALETGVIFLLVMCFETQGIAVSLQSWDDCDRTFDLNEGEVTLDYWDGVDGDCEIIFTGSSDSDYPRICVKPIELELGDCTVEVDVHNGNVVEGYENQRYSCSTSAEESCTYLDKVTVIFKRVGQKPQSQSIDIKLKIYNAKSEFDTETSGTGTIIAMVVISSVLTFVAAIACIIFTRYRRRALLARATEYRQPQQLFTPYPAVQYQAANQSVGGNQQPGTGYPPSGPVSGYPLQPQGYSIQPHTGYQPVDQGANQSVAGYQQPATAFPPTQPVQGYPLQPQGYPIQPQTGFQSVDQGAYLGHSVANQSTPPAPRTSNSSDLPPSYDKALELAERKGI